MPGTDEELLLAIARGDERALAELYDRLGVPLGTVKSRMFAGLSKLRDQLDEPG